MGKHDSISDVFGGLIMGTAFERFDVNADGAWDWPI